MRLEAVRDGRKNRLTRPQLLLAILLLAYLAHGIFLAFALVPDGDAEGAYLYHGWLAVTGQIGLYQDGMTGHRMPLPYYVFGLSQVFSPSLLVARLLSVAMGFGAVFFVWRLGAAFGAGTLTLLFAVTQSYLLGHFAWATFHSLISLLLAAGLYVWLGTTLRWRRVLATVASTLLVFTRPQMWPLHPLALVVLWRQAESRLERWLIGLIGTVPVAVFFLWDVDHWKLFTMIPGLKGVAAAIGFVPVEIPYRVEHDWGVALTEAARLLGRSYKDWIVAAVVLAVVSCMTRRRIRNPRVLAVTITLVYIAAWQFLAIRYTLEAAVGYFPSFAILAAIPLGYCFSRFHRAQIILPLVFLFGPAWSPHPALPLRVGPTQMAMLNDRVAEIKGLIPRRTTVFLFGSPLEPYLAGLRVHLAPATHLETLSTVENDWVRVGSGQWGEPEIRRWLWESDWAIVRLSTLRHARPDQQMRTGNNVDLIETILGLDYEVAATLPSPPGPPLTVFRRVASRR